MILDVIVLYYIAGWWFKALRKILVEMGPRPAAANIWACAIGSWHDVCILGVWLPSGASKFSEVAIFSSLLFFFHRPQPGFTCFAPSIPMHLRIFCLRNVELVLVSYNLYCIILYCITLNYIIIYYITLYYVVFVLYYIISYYIKIYYITLYYII